MSVVDRAVQLSSAGALLKIFCVQRPGLNVCLMNARSVRNKVDELSLLFANTDIHAIIVSETWLNENIPSTLVSIPGYKLFRNDRKLRIGGGVGIYVRDYLRARTVYSSKDGIIEFLCVELNNGTEKCILSAVYCPPGCFSYDHASELETAFSELSRHYSNIIVGGDFNVDILRSNNTSNEFLHFMQSLYLNAVNSLPTYYNTSRPSLLDLMFAADRRRVLFHNQMDSPSFLDHDILFMSYDFTPKCLEHVNYFTYRDFNNLNSNSLIQECMALPWDRILLCSSVDDQIEIFEGILKYLFDKYVPLRTKRSSSSACPWHTTEVRLLISEREYLYKRSRRLKSQTAYSMYKTARNRVTAAVRAAKSRYFGNKFDASLPSKVLWRNLKKAGVFGEQGSVVDCNFDPNELNRHFVSASASVSNSNNNTSSAHRTDLLRHNADTFAFRSVDYQEFRNALLSIKRLASTTSHQNLLKYCCPISANIYFIY